jgi:hypothetical protein
MKNISLVEALENCADACGWCVHQCPDKDKYDMLVYCISIQKEFLAVGSLVNNILSGRSEVTMKKIFKFFEIIAGYFQENNSTGNKNDFREAGNSKDGLRLPGCSQIFMVSQSLGQIYSDDSLNDYN